jgi:uncharacterized membrane protein YedE/YeeE
MQVSSDHGPLTTPKRRMVRMNKQPWSPYLAGTCLGLTLLATFFIAGRGLGASGAISLAAAIGLRFFAPDHAGRLAYLSQYFDSPSPLLNWNLFLIAGVFLGGLAGALMSKGIKPLFDRPSSMSIGVRIVSSFAGGILIGFAARLARGCTSGVALTGGAQLAPAGWIFVIAMFAAGFLFAALFRRFWS